jgi:hypothetical protein
MQIKNNCVDLAHLAPESNLTVKLRLAVLDTSSAVARRDIEGTRLRSANSASCMLILISSRQWVYPTRNLRKRASYSMSAVVDNSAFTTVNLVAQLAVRNVPGQLCPRELLHNKE